MNPEHTLIYVNSESGDLALRQIAWDLLARGWVLRATYLDGAVLTVSDTGAGEAVVEKTLMLLCESSKVDVILDHLGYAVQAVAVPVTRAVV